MDAEAHIAVDIEASGPIPGEYSMLSIGACLVSDSAETFYVELRPISDQYDPEALKVCGLSVSELKRTGTAPEKAMGAFAGWVRRVSAGRRPVMVAFNAPFDWSFVNWYFHKFFGRNPFGVGAWDLKAYYLGVVGKFSWLDSVKSRLDPRFTMGLRHTHNALDDAREYAELFKRLRTEAENRHASSKGFSESTQFGHFSC